MNKTVTSVLCAVILWGGLGFAADPISLYESPTPAQPNGELDRIVFAKLQTLGVQPILCSDAVFIRRAFLDMTGTIPTAQEVREFLDDQTPDKRARLVDRLMERKEFLDYWSMKWGDALRIKAEIPVNLWPNGARAFHRYIWASLASNKPYDQFVREMLTASGSNFRDGAVNFYRAVQDRSPTGIASTVALTLMGVRTDHWPKERLEGMAVFFSQIAYKPTSEWKEQVVFWDPWGLRLVPTNFVPGREAPGTAPRKSEDPIVTPTPADISQEPLVGVFPDGTKVTIPADRDPREVFADWLIRPENPWFTRCIVNRIWVWIMGRGIIHEPDDIRDDNPPSNPELLSYLEKELIQSGYNLRHLYKVILTSSTYQLTSIPRKPSPEVEANFGYYVPRRLDAEILIDALNKITGATDLYTSAIPEPYTYIPRDLTAVSLADGSVISPFLTLFGRSARSTGAFNERSNKPTPSQWLYMLNSSQVYNKIATSQKLGELFRSGRPVPELIEEVYLTVLSRRPSEEEMTIAREYIEKSRSRGEAAMDVVWALINTEEFLYRH
ncbi:MAG TPA: DUF1553 domain-containing protein [Thermogutta sp.]|nr:DUF1553 domain-containing protein [Thermogutta sp.]HPU04990.1 DUF1553 domain-containing protein [Thermogutta sp.]HPZ82264.1 DUF1553 domain-containing protein [Thermogutta sp.]HQF13175.1 DUF1553 domain-containing protein [Thermogutta sp.]